MTDRDLIVVGASAGGVEALRVLAAGLPTDLTAAVLIVLHMPRSAPSALPSILGRVTKLPVRAAVDGEPLRRGRIYVAPVDRHLLVLENRISLSRGPAENGHRPAVDPLFRSAAMSFGDRVVGVVLSGSRDDGAAGLEAILSRGGTGVVQDPASALYPWMPMAAIDRAKPQHIVSMEEIGPLLGELTKPGVSGVLPEITAQSETGAAMNRDEMVTLIEEEGQGTPAGYGCPSCGGSLFELDDSAVPRFRCRIGHAWSAESLLDEQAAALEGALWMALRALEEKAELSDRMARNSSNRGNERSAGRFRSMSLETETAAGVVRDLIDRLGPRSA